MSGINQPTLVLCKNYDEFLKRRLSADSTVDTQRDELLREIVYGKSEPEHEQFIDGLASEIYSLLNTDEIDLSSGLDNDKIINFTPVLSKEINSFKKSKENNKEYILQLLKGEQTGTEEISKVILSLILYLMTRRQIESYDENFLKSLQTLRYNLICTFSTYEPIDFAKNNLSSIVDIFYFLQKKPDNDPQHSVANNELKDKQKNIVIALPDALSHCPQGAQNALKTIMQNCFSRNNNILTKISRYASYVIAPNASNEENVHKIEAMYLIAENLDFNPVVNKKTNLDKDNYSVNIMQNNFDELKNSLAKNVAEHWNIDDLFEYICDSVIGEINQRLAKSKNNTVSVQSMRQSDSDKESFIREKLSNLGISCNKDDFPDIYTIKGVKGLFCLALIYDDIVVNDSSFKWDTGLELDENNNMTANYNAETKIVALRYRDNAGLVHECAIDLADYKEIDIDTISIHDINSVVGIDNKVKETILEYFKNEKLEKIDLKTLANIKGIDGQNVQQTIYLHKINNIIMTSDWQLEINKQYLKEQMVSSMVEQGLIGTIGPNDNYLETAVNPLKIETIPTSNKNIQMKYFMNGEQPVSVSFHDVANNRTIPFMTQTYVELYVEHYKKFINLVQVNSKDTQKIFIGNNFGTWVIVNNGAKSEGLDLSKISADRFDQILYLLFGDIKIPYLLENEIFKRFFGQLSFERQLKMLNMAKISQIEQYNYFVMHYAQHAKIYLQHLFSSTGPIDREIIKVPAAMQEYAACIFNEKQVVDLTAHLISNEEKTLMTELFENIKKLLNEYNSSKKDYHLNTQQVANIDTILSKILEVGSVDNNKNEQYLFVRKIAESFQSFLIDILNDDKNQVIDNFLSFIKRDSFACNSTDIQKAYEILVATISLTKAKSLASLQDFLFDQNNNAILSKIYHYKYFFNKKLADNIVCIATDAFVYFKYNDKYYNIEELLTSNDLSKALIKNVLDDSEINLAIIKYIEKKGASKDLMEKLEINGFFASLAKNVLAEVKKSDAEKMDGKRLLFLQEECSPNQIQKFAKDLFTSFDEKEYNNVNWSEMLKYINLITPTFMKDAAGVALLFSEKTINILTAAKNKTNDFKFEYFKIDDSNSCVYSGNLLCFKHENQYYTIENLLALGNDDSQTPEWAKAILANDRVITIINELISRNVIKQSPQTIKQLKALNFFDHVDKYLKNVPEASDSLDVKVIASITRLYINSKNDVDKPTAIAMLLNNEQFKNKNIHIAAFELATFAQKQEIFKLLEAKGVARINYDTTENQLLCGKRSIVRKYGDIAFELLLQRDYYEGDYFGYGSGYDHNISANIFSSNGSYCLTNNEVWSICTVLKIQGQDKKNTWML